MDKLKTYEVLTQDKFLDLKRTIKKNAGQQSIIKIKNLTIGNGVFSYMLGPCAVENEKMLDEICNFISSNNLGYVRAGTYKLRSNPYSYQGLGNKGVILLEELAKQYNLVTISEIPGISELEEFCKHIDIIMVGQRNMFNLELLKALGKTKKPIILKRSPGATLYELLASAEYILNEGNPNVILCERGIRGFDPYNRYMIDMGAVIALKELTHLPVIVDPSHAMGRSNLIIPLARAIKASGADGIICEIHPYPEKAQSDKLQALNLNEAKRMVEDCEKIKF